MITSRREQWNEHDEQEDGSDIEVRTPWAKRAREHQQGEMRTVRYRDREKGEAKSGLTLYNEKKGPTVLLLLSTVLK